jgi:uncharacterized membrane protein YgcG
MKGFRRAHSAVFRLFLAAFLAVSLLASVAGRAVAERVEDLPKPTDYVSDFAHVLSPATVARLDSICSQLDHSQANAQVFRTSTARTRLSLPTLSKTSGRWAARARIAAC